MTVSVSLDSFFVCDTIPPNSAKLKEGLARFDLQPRYVFQLFIDFPGFFVRGIFFFLIFFGRTRISPSSVHDRKSFVSQMCC